MNIWNNFIREKLSGLNYFFTRDEAMRVLGLSPDSFKRKAAKMIKEGVIKRIKRNSFLILPVEYSKQKIPPQIWVVKPMMQHLGIKEYYIGLLSSAYLHNVLESEPAKLQIIIDKPTRDIKMEGFLIEFHVYKECKSAKRENIALPTGGKAIVSSKEQTVLDLIRFQADCGYIDNITPTIKKLSGSCSANGFLAAISQEKHTPHLQRLGYILEFVQLGNLASMVEKELSGRKMQYILLRPDLAHAELEKRNERFKIMVNDPKILDN